MAENAQTRPLIGRYSFLLFVTMIVYGYLYHSFFGAILIAKYCLFAGVLCLVSPLVQRVTKSSDLALIFLILSSISVAIFTAVFTGGTQSPVIFWVVVVPIAGGFIDGGYYSSVRWLVVALICIVGVWFNEIIAPQVNIVNGDQRVWVGRFALIGVTLVCATFTHLFSRQVSREKLEVELQKQRIEAKSNALEEALENLNNAKAALVQSEKLSALGSISALIAHEVNNSMNYASGGAAHANQLVEKLVDCPQKAEILECLRLVTEGTAVTIEIVENIRNYAGTNTAKFDRIDLKRILDSIVKISGIKLQEGHKHVSVTLDIEPELALLGSPVGFYQIFVNLINNAVDSIEKSGQIHVTGTARGDRCEILFRDTGLGMSKEVAARAFDPFFTTKSDKGAGIGMHVVKTEVQRHKGTVSLESCLGTGTKVIMSFPMNLKIVNGELV